ncbi:MAG: ABC transporter substrate-binding protein [Actinomycetota bacterium]
MTRSWLSVRPVAAIALALVLAACGGGDDDDGNAGGDGNGATETTDSPGEPPSDLPDCPLDSLAAAAEPVEIEFWHAMTRANKDELERLTNEFNSSQDKVRVTLSESASYVDNLTRYRAALGTDEVPALVQIEDTGLQLMIDSQSALPAAACIAADHYDTSDHIERVLSYYTVQDVLWPMPFNVSNPILYYNKADFTEAGLDPAQPPTTLDDVRAAAQAIVDSGAAPYGIAFKVQPWFLEHWFAMANHTYVNNGNGRAERATEVDFGDEQGLELFTWLQDMYDDGLLLNTGAAENSIDHYLAVGNGEAAMTIDSSAALGTIFQLLNSGQFPGVELGAGAIPGPQNDEGGPLVGGAALYIVNRAAPEQQAAAYEFAKFLNEPQRQAEFAAATGYVPVRKSAIELDPLTLAFGAQPELQIAYDQLLSGAETEATAGPVIGAYGAAGQGVRGAVIDAIGAMFTEGTDPADALAAAVEGSNAAMEEYNSRVG